MAMKISKKTSVKDFTELRHLPRGKSGWSAALACLAYGTRMDVEKKPPDLNAWAARHGLAASERYRELGEEASKGDPGG